MDVISRKAAIDAVDSETVSTNPEHFKSSEKFIKFMNNADISSFGKWQWANGFNTALVATTIRLKKLPSVQPEIVRCKDCKHRIEHKHYGDLGESAYTCEGNMVGWILPDDFCSHAERRTDERTNQGHEDAGVL